MTKLLDKIAQISKIDIFKNISKKHNRVLGIDIGTSAIKIVEIKKQAGKAVLENYGAIALGPYGDLEVGRAVNLPKENIIEAMQDLFNETNITAKNAAIAIPMKDAMISLIKVPALSSKDLESMIPIEARRYIPVPMSEVTLNFQVIPQEDTKKTKYLKNKKSKHSKHENLDTVDVLIATIHNNAIVKYQEIKNIARINADLFEIEIFSTIRSVVGYDMSTIMVIDIGAGTTKLAIVEHGIIRGSHVIRRGSQDITIALSKSLGISISRAEEVKRNPALLDNATRKNFADVASLSVDHIFSQANSVLLDYQRKHNKTVDKVILSGGGAIMEGLLGLAKENFKAEVIMGDPFARLETPAFMESTLKKAGPEFAVSVGLALEIL